jgi:hypothetical protein
MWVTFAEFESLVVETLVSASMQRSQSRMMQCGSGCGLLSTFEKIVGICK